MEPRQSSQRTFALLTFLMVAAPLALAAQLAGDPVHSGLWHTLLGAVCVGAVLVGTMTRSGATRRLGLALALSLLLTTAGDAAFTAYDAAGVSPFPSPADALYLLAYVPAAVVILGLTRRRAAWRTALLDACTVTLAVGLPLWLLVGEPAVKEGALTARLLGLAYPLADLVLLVMLAGVLLERGPVGRGALLLAGGALALVVSDVAFAVLSASGSYVPGGPADLGWIVHRVMWGVAGLGALAPRPSRSSLNAMPAGQLRITTMAVLATSAPGSLVLRPDPDRGDIVVTLLVSLLLTLLLLLRLHSVSRELDRATQEQQEQVRRAEVVAGAGAVLLRAGDRSEVQLAAVRAVLALVVRAQGRGAAALALGPPALLHLVAADARGVRPDQAGQIDLDVLCAEDRARLDRGQEVERRTGPEACDDLVLVLPLTVPSRPVGALIVVGEVEWLTQARVALRGLAALVALALDAAQQREAQARPAPRPPVGVALRGTIASRDNEGLPLTSRPSAAGPVDEIARGLRSREFTAHYQPIVGLVDGRARGFEALVRWNHPQRGLLLPGSFLGEVERSGLLGQLDSLVLRTACEQAVRFDPRHSGPYVSVNASVAQLLDQDFPRLVRSALTAASLPPWRLMIEVTETTSLQDPTAVADVLRRLREQRVRIAFDDFGTGYSSLSWLQQLPLDVVKIDKTFVDRLPHAAGERPVVEALVKMSQTLGLSVIAEGVETEGQRTALLNMGVELGQGWLFSRAVPATEAALLLPEGPHDRLRNGRLVLRSG